MALAFAYNSLDPSDGPIGYGWRHNYAMRMVSNVDGTRTIIQEGGATVLFEPDGTGGWRAPPRSEATLEANGDGTITFTRNEVEFFDFDGSGRLISISDLNSYETILTYDSSTARLATVQDDAGRSLVFNWSGGRLASIVDPHDGPGGPRSVAFSYDAAGNLVTFSDVGGGTWVMQYDASHRLVTARTPRHDDPTKVYEWHYDALGRVDWEEDPLSRRTEVHYDDPEAGATRIVEPDGDERVDWYNPLGQRIRVTEGYGTPDETSTSYEYDASTFMVRKTVDGEGREWLADYGDPSNPRAITSMTDPMLRTTAATYNTRGQLLTTTDAEGVLTAYTYDAQGNVESIVEAVGTPEEATTGFIYGDVAHPGDATGVIDARGKLWQTTYDPTTGYPSQSVDPEGNVSTSEFNSLGWTVSRVSPRGYEAGAIAADYRTTYGHNRYGDVVMTTNPAGETITRQFDANRNLVSVEDAEGERSTYTYNDADEMIGERRPDNSHVSYSYFPDGTLQSRTDPASNTTTYTYDSVGRMATATDPLGRTTSFEYDKAGNRISMQQPGGDCTAGTGCVAYNHDVSNQLVFVNYSDPATVDVALDYDAVGRRIKMVDGTGTSTSTWDARDRLTSHTNGSGASVSYTHDKTGNLTSILYPGQTTPVVRAFDDAGRLVSVTDWFGNRTDFEWDSNTNLQSILFPAATGSTDSFTYDRADRVSGINWKKSNVPYASTIYDRHGDGSIASATSAGLPDGPAQFDYDRLDQITNIDGGPQGYGYDSADNLTQLANGTAQSFDAAGQLTTATSTNGSVVYTYDGRGNRTTTVGTGALITNVFDQADRLTDVVNVGASTTTTYAYDGDGLRTSLAEQGADERTFTWDRSGHLPALLTEGNGTETTYIVYGPGTTPIAEISDAGALTWLHVDHLGTVRAATDDTGATVGTWTYDAYGQVTERTGTTDPLLSWAGEYKDDSTGLVYLRARYYDPATGQFLNRDPAVSATHEPYAYASNNPVNMVDPLGLAPWDVIGSAWDGTGGRAVSAVSSVGTQDVANFAGGVLNTITFGNEHRINRALGQEAKVHRASGAYTAGEITGIAVDIKAGSKVVFSASSRLPRLADWLSQTKYVGSRSYLFGRGYHGTRGILNHGPGRLGWGWNGSREVFRMGFGTPGRWTHCHWDLL